MLHMIFDTGRLVQNLGFESESGMISSKYHTDLNVIISPRPPQNMKERMTRTLNRNHNTEQIMNFMVIRKIDPTSQHRLLQIVVQVICLAQKQYHIQGVIKPSGGARNSEEDH